MAHRELSADAGYINAGREIHSPFRATPSSIRPRHPLSPVLSPPPPPRPLTPLFYPRIFALASPLPHHSPPLPPRAPPPAGTCKSHGRVVPLTAPRTLYFLARIPRGRKARLYFYVGFNRGFTRIFETISPLRGPCVSITLDRSRVEDRSHRSLHISCTLTH